MSNFALADAQGISAAVVLFGALSLFPGYLICHFLNIWQFRTRTSAFQLAASVSLSCGFGPIFTFLLGSCTNWRVVWLAYLTISVAAIIVLIRSKPRVDKTILIAAAVGVAWTAFAGAWLMDWQFGSRVYFPYYAFDHGTRAQFVHSLAAFGLPAQSPVFNPGHPVALHYHFLWLLQCALVEWLAPSLVSARTALIAGAIWCALSLMCVTGLAMRLFMARRSWIAIALLTVTGVDLLPTPPLLATHMPLLGLLHTAIWEPHYICALVACVTGFCVLWQSPGIARSIIAALCLASAAGSGSFVALVFAAFLAVWILFNFRQCKSFILAGLFAAILLLPFLAMLQAPAQNVGGPSTLAFILSPFSPPEMDAALKLLLLPAHYLLEFGVFAVCVLVSCRRKLAPHEWALVTMAVTSTLICSFVKSQSTPNNDLGWRGFLVAQFALLLLAAFALHQKPPSLPLKLLLGLGLVCTGSELFTARFDPILSDRSKAPKLEWLGTDQRLGERTFSNREAYTWLRRHSAATATIGQNPNVHTIDIFSSLYADRRLVAGDRTCTIGFGGRAEECKPIVAQLTSLFAGQTDYAAACRSLTADFYVVKDTDPVWNQPNSWPWLQSPVYVNRFVRILACKK